MENHTSAVEEFILLGFPIRQETEILLSVVLLCLYLLTLFSNMVILCIVYADGRLHTPMYFFLCNLSALDLFFTSVTVPKMLQNLISGDKSISFAGCMAQSYFYFFLGTVEFFLLTSMSYDRYAAICSPLHYPILMSSRVCAQMMMACWLGGLLSILFPTIMISRLSYCRSNVIDHFFCDSGPLLELSCTDTHLVELIDFMLSSLVILGSLTLTMISYVFIISTILRIPTNTGRNKAFSTCATHLTLVLMSGSISIFMYVTPSQKSTLEMHKIPAVLSSIVNPLLNPFIYTLRNDIVKKVLRETFSHSKALVFYSVGRLFLICAAPCRKRSVA
ncbi:olfactory receptor 6J1 [Mauremys reevesii]|uniref:olfactory receptor 6J1 n=1 Tax=Mauremys reevesii TaxID=260615 RepID=UPI00193F25A9|nr:olfactory receptor 6J1 [Mauremys reevesii]